MNALQKEMEEFHSNNSILNLTVVQQRIFYSLAMEYALETIGVIADCRLKINQSSKEVRKMEKELGILQTLKMQQNIADVEKNKRLRNTMISKWNNVIEQRLKELKDLESKESSLIQENDLTVSK